MSWWKRQKSEQIWVDLEGLGLLIDDLHHDMGMSEIVNGPWIQIRIGMSEETEGLFLVTLQPHLVNRLRKRVSSYEFSDVYGPRARRRAGRGAPDGTE